LCGRQDWDPRGALNSGESAASDYAGTKIANYVSGLPLLAFIAPAIVEAIKPNCGAPRSRGVKQNEPTIRLAEAQAPAAGR
jgi:hypothetical protein